MRGRVFTQVQLQLYIQYLFENAPSLPLSGGLQEMHYASNVYSWSTGSTIYTVK